MRTRQLSSETRMTKGQPRHWYWAANNLHRIPDVKVKQFHMGTQDTRSGTDAQDRRVKREDRMEASQ
jgi:hypothetical protein